MPLDNATRTLLSGLTDDFDKAQAASGGRVWPPDGEHVCTLDALTLRTDGQFRLGQNREPLPAIELAFEYTMLNDPDRAQPLQWAGETFSLPVRPGNIPADLPGQKQRYEIALGRLKRALGTILGLNPDNVDLIDGITRVQELVSGDSAVTVRVRVSSRKAKTGSGVYHSDDILEVLSGPAV